jgi:CBS domain-containing protein
VFAVDKGEDRFAESLGFMAFGSTGRIKPDSKKLTRRAVQIVQDMETDVLARISAAEIMDRGVHTVDESVTIRDAYERAIDTGQRALPIANQDRELVGVITQTDLNRAFEADHTDYPLGEYATGDIVTTFPEQLLSGAAFKFSEVNQLPVVERLNRRHLLGMLTRKRPAKSAWSRAGSSRRLGRYLG